MKLNIIPAILTAILLIHLVPVVKAESGPDNYVLVLQMIEYDAQLQHMLSYFFEKILKPQDNLALITPIKPYKMSPQTRVKYPLEKLVEALAGYLKKDIAQYGSTYMPVLSQLTQDIRDITRALSGDSDPNLKTYFLNYRNGIKNLNILRRLNESFFLNLAQSFRNDPAPTTMFVFCQQIHRAIPNRTIMDRINRNNDLKMYTMELFQPQVNEVKFDVEKVGAALREAKITLHFFYLLGDSDSGYQYDLMEHTGEVFGYLSDVAKFTDGDVQNSRNPESALKKIHK